MTKLGYWFVYTHWSRVSFFFSIFSCTMIKIYTNIYGPMATLCGFKSIYPSLRPSVHPSPWLFTPVGSQGAEAWSKSRLDAPWTAYKSISGLTRRDNQYTYRQGRTTSNLFRQSKNLQTSLREKKAYSIIATPNGNHSNTMPLRLTSYFTFFFFLISAKLSIVLSWNVVQRLMFSKFF